MSGLTRCHKYPDLDASSGFAFGLYACFERHGDTFSATPWMIGALSPDKCRDGRPSQPYVAHPAPPPLPPAPLILYATLSNCASNAAYTAFVPRPAANAASASPGGPSGNAGTASGECQLFTSGDQELVATDNVSDWSLIKFRTHYGDGKITKDAIFE